VSYRSNLPVNGEGRGKDANALDFVVTGCLEAVETEDAPASGTVLVAALVTTVELEEAAVAVLDFLEPEAALAVGD
jgi:hypothetical protein